MSVLTSYECEDPQRHHQDGDHEVGDGQRHEKVVGDVLQPPLPTNGQANQDVAAGRADGQTYGRKAPPVVTLLLRRRAVKRRRPQVYGCVIKHHRGNTL